MALQIRIFDFQVTDFNEDFKIQMYGLDEHRTTYSIMVHNFTPFVYIKVSNDWNKHKTDEFIEHLKQHPNKSIAYGSKDIVSYEWVKKKSLYGFDANKYYNFIYISCKNMSFVYKLRSLYYEKDTQQLNKGYLYKNAYTKIYECMIPPLLRFFHIQNISPSGWIEVKRFSRNKMKKTHMDVDINCDYKNIYPLDKEIMVPYKICSFDIEANSSHGDFPEAAKDYKKVAYDIVYYLEHQNVQDYDYILRELLENVFGFKDTLLIDKCYVEQSYTYEQFESHMELLFKRKIATNYAVANKLKEIFSKDDEDDEESSYVKLKKINMNDVLTMLKDITIDKPNKIVHLTNVLDETFPQLKGDQVTFIGSTFVNYGEEKPYLNHCICLNDSHNIGDNVLECYSTEKDVLCAWSRLIMKEDPDIIIGYNIFGFDYPFMYERANQLNCMDEFMVLGRNKEQSTKLFETSIVLASGPYDLKMLPMSGRLQIDLYTYMRKEFNLPSYKLDYVSSYLICDKVIRYENNEEGQSRIYSKNMKGLERLHYVHFEIHNHSSELYLDGKKFQIIELYDDGFLINEELDIHEKFSWGLSKDDVSPKDIFEMTKKGPHDRGIIAKYCIQDCNLVHQIFQKVDVLTTFSEMSKLCSVPIQFLVLRGQGIKLTSYISKKCREKDTLMPLISKGNDVDAYEGAIVLEPKCGLYLNNPVACVDYSSLYPSSIISENISHDSKVWTKEFDLNDHIKKDEKGREKMTGIKDEHSNFIYDNLPEYEYVDIQYDTFEYVRNTPTSAATKQLTGYKICRYAQFPDNKKAILPSILQELLAARKATKKQMQKETDPFKKNILDKRQLSIKITANSLYGQTGAKTSSFYEMDVAASTTSVGRTLLIYAKEIIENVYGNTIVDTKYGKMKSNAEYIYGDTDSVFFTFNFKDLKNNTLPDKQLLDMTIEVAKEAGHLCTSFLKEPHDLEYEKTFMPFCLLSKKRYVGMLYEDDINSCSRKSMGIVLKRRDNAPIVKDVYGGIIDILMKEKDIEKSILFLDKMLENIIDENIIMDKLVVTKSLRSFYKNPTRIAHCVLANRMGARDQKPSPGDRIPFVYIKNENKQLQGDKIETPDFIKSEGLEIDYVFYITNQIMKPIIQIYSLVLNDMKCFQRRKPSFIQEVETLSKNEFDTDKRNKKIQSMKEKEVERLLFKKYISFYPEEMDGMSYQYRTAFDVCKKLGKNEKEIVNAILKHKKNKK